MLRPGDPARWANELHQVLKPAEQLIMERAIKNYPGSGFDAERMVLTGAAKTHRSAQFWINKLEARGLLEKQIAGRRALWFVTDYGRWMTRGTR